MMTSKIAFSWTCQPKRNEAKPQAVTQPMKLSHVGFMKGFIMQTCIRSTVDLLKQVVVVAYQLNGQSQIERSLRRNVKQENESGITNKPTSHAVGHIFVEVIMSDSRHWRACEQEALAATKPCTTYLVSEPCRPKST